MSDRPSEWDLHRWLDGELTPEEAAAVEHHLAGDPAARARLDDYSLNEERLRAAFAALEQDALPPRLGSMGERLQSSLGRRRWHAIAPALAASIAAFAIGVGTRPFFEPLLPWRVPPVVETAARAHEVFDTTSEVEVPGSARRELAERVERHLGMDVAIPELRAVGYDLVGGRLLVSEEGPLAQILYEDGRGVRLTLYVSGAETVPAEEITVVEVEKLAAGYWRSDEIAYSVVAAMDVDSLRDVAAEISAMIDPHRS